MENEIINRVASSGIVTLDLEEYYPTGERVIYDIKDNLFQGLILREKDFREFLKSNDWSIYSDQHVAITCSEDAIIPTWAYMLLATKLAPFAKTVTFGTLESLEEKIFASALNHINLEEFRDKRVVVKGCSKINVPISTYMDISLKLKPVVQSLMFGEPCSTVPIYKKPRN